MRRDAAKSGMSQESNAPSTIEQVVARALRDNLERIQRTSDELHQAIADVVAACSSAKPANALPPMLRAQTASASLTASLEVLSRFVAVTLQPGSRAPFEAEIARLAGSAAAAETVATVAAVRAAPAAATASAKPVPPPAAAHPPHAVGHEPVEEHHAPAHEPAVAETLEAEVAPPVPGEHEDAAEFSVSRLSEEEQELHRRANRVAKVSMQDIKMLRPEQVRLGREHKDLCIRLRDDIEKAHREYDRRFKPIMDHPVDYFYRWMVEILAEGDPHALGEYPYATTGTRH
jgi:hypothetical protein